MKNTSTIILSLLLLSTIVLRGQQKDLNPNLLAEELVRKAMAAEDTQTIRKALALIKVGELENSLDTNEKRLAFWVNFYNGYIQYFLRQDPSRYEDRSGFFKKDQIRIAGEVISFAKIEHGLIRKSQWEYGLGNIGKIFVDDFEKRLRVEEPDYRIHFALNCGAVDCPPVAIYEWKRLEEQFRKGTARYLKRTSTFDPNENEVTATTLFSWFRGDFGGTDGILEILRQQGIIPNTEVDLEFSSYDWTLALDNFIKL